MQEKKEKFITSEKRSLNICSKGPRDLRRLREQLAKQPAPRPEELKEIDTMENKSHGRGSAREFAEAAEAR